MTDSLFIGIDIGTQGTKAVLCNTDGNVIADSFCSSVLFRPNDKTVYEEPENIFSSVITVISQLTAKAEEKSQNIRAIAIDAQMAGIMGIKNNFEASMPLDSWLDTRCSEYTELLKIKAGDSAIKMSGGQFIHAHAPKILWWKNEYKDIYDKTEKFIQPNGYVAGKLCGLKVEDAFMDYTFLHFNLFSDNLNCCFNKDMLKDFGIDESKMPKIISPETVVGTVTDEYAEKCGLPRGVQFIAGCGDTAASSLGAGITSTGLAYDVAGTASVFACCTDRFVPDTLNKTLLFSRSVCEDLFLPLSYISGGGLCLEWFSTLTGKSLKELDKAVTETNPQDIPIFIPHFSGRTFPLDNRISGAFFGLNSQSDSASMHKAIMEAIAFEYKSYYDILCKSNCITSKTTVIGVGGGAKSDVFSQLKADVLGIDYATPKKADSAPVAMALLAAHATGYISEPLSEIFVPDKNSTVYKPNSIKTETYKIKAEKYLHLLNNYGSYIT